MIEIQGVVRGNRIELISPVGLQDGTAVLVRLEPQPQLSLAEKQAFLHQLYGSWSGDPSLEAIFAEIANQRTEARPRSVDFDTP